LKKDMGILGTGSFILMKNVKVHKLTQRSQRKTKKLKALTTNLVISILIFLKKKKM